LRVLDANKRARAFYERRGWRLAEGTHGHDGVFEVRYEYALGTLPDPPDRLDECG